MSNFLIFILQFLYWVGLFFFLYSFLFLSIKILAERP